MPECSSCGAKTERVQCRSCSGKIGHKTRATGKLHHAMISKPCAVCNISVIRYAAVFRRRPNAVVTCSTSCRGEATRRGLIVQKHSGVATQAYRQGIDNPKWTGSVWKGLSYGPGWSKQRKAARERDEDTCQHCSKTREQAGRPLDVHHIVRFMSFATSAEANVLTNLITLCRQCHVKADRKQREELGPDIASNVKYGPALKPRTRPRFTSFSEVACLLARNWFLQTTSPKTEDEDMRGLGHALCRAVLGQHSRGLQKTSDLCQAGSLLKANAEIEADCWRFTLAGETTPDLRPWSDMLACGDHRRIATAERAAFLDWTCIDAVNVWPGWTGYNPLTGCTEYRKLASATRRPFGDTCTTSS